MTTKFLIKNYKLFSLCGPWLRFIFISAVLSFACSLLALAILMVSSRGEENYSELSFSGLSSFFSIVVISPLLETWIMGLLLRWLKKVNALSNIYCQCILSSLFWALIHSLALLHWGAVVAIPFFIYSYGYLHWLEPNRRIAFMTAFTIHSLNNLGGWIFIRFLFHG